ncbi:MAG TPA: hypothetical protein VK675_01015 [Candidatus Paceibacterota bacterium]|nr:hypothetical protein [Candidatus Paceibacterota bacterium]
MRKWIEGSAIKIETVKTEGGNEVSFCPERGGIITSIKLGGREVLYLDLATLEDKSANVRGGIPILFPNAGPLEGPQYPNLKQHGFGRYSREWKAETTGQGFKETLLANGETKKIFPFDFRLSIKVSFEKDGSFTINQEVENLEEARELPLSMGLHPYFKIPQDKKGEVKFNFEGGKFVEEQVGVWANGKYISIDNPKIKDPSAVMEIVIPDLGTLLMNASAEYKKVWIWSMAGKDFFCVEPVMRDSGGLVDDPEMIRPKTTFTARLKLTLKE